MALDVEDIMLFLVTLYLKYSGREGDPETLTKQELRDLILTELPFGKKLHPAELESFFEELDLNKDNEVNFVEFSTFLGSLVRLYQDEPRKDL
ncbi:PREDICTED: protein S100-A6-like [Chinchilla lanigera]|uniref:Protein S100 n=1 Tax=Chinchilla lanigera TaxID=34839 RepID=A0A8C2V576_CHILA|nr:PREDICTED: protein S100-A6-like [Chinchilla lanigera]